ncbi:MAG: endo-1,4-beta-xylanase [Chitinophagales bacterium]
MTTKLQYCFLSLWLVFNLCSCSDAPKTDPPKDTSTEVPSLKSAFAGDFYIGAAVNDGHINQTDTAGLTIIEAEFNTITPENIMKWMYIHPAVDSFYFDMADKYIALGKKNNMHIVGHTLLWHSQIAEWMNEVKDSAVMANHIENHINTIAGHFKGKIDTWDVVNEALNEDGSFRESSFLKVMGESYIEHAFKLAAAADPNAELIYNDYNLWKPEKRAGVVRLVKNLQEKGIKIDGVGMQAHWSLIGPGIEDIENSILAYSALGVKVMFTELDVTALPNPWDLEGAEISQNYDKYKGDPVLNPFPSELPDSMQVKLAERYEDIFKLFLKHEDKISRVTFWGVNDGQSWLNGWPIEERTNYPLFFDRKFKRKMAYGRVMNLKKQASPQ